MPLQLKPPFLIGGRLLPAIRIGDVWISMERLERRENRYVFRWTIDMPDGSSHTGSDMDSPRSSIQEAFANILGFLSAAAEAYGYELQTGRKSENIDLFPKPVVEWAYQNSDDIDVMACGVEETEGLIVE